MANEEQKEQIRLLKEHKNKVLREISEYQESKILAEEQRKLKEEIKELEAVKPKGKVEKVLDKAWDKVMGKK